VLIVNGADRDRTGDPLVANQVLSQLSYRPFALLDEQFKIRYKVAESAPLGLRRRAPTSDAFHRRVDRLGRTT
jgi:hypothetical protein